MDAFNEIQCGSFRKEIFDDFGVAVEGGGVEGGRAVVFGDFEVVFLGIDGPAVVKEAFHLSQVAFPSRFGQESEVVGIELLGKLGVLGEESVGGFEVVLDDSGDKVVERVGLGGCALGL